MKLFARVIALTAITTLTALLFTSAAVAGPPGKWTKFTGPHGNTAEIGLARTADGRLHALSPQDTGLGGNVNSSALSADAKSVSGPQVVHSYPAGLNPSMALVAMPGGLRAFFSGLYNSESDPLQGGLATATSADGSTWSVQPTLASATVPSKKSVYAASGISAALGLDGTPHTVWGDAGSGYHSGLSDLTPDSNYSSGCCVYEPGVGVDAVTGEVAIAWAFLQASDGTAYQTISPLGGRMQPPNGNAADTSARAAITGRIGAPGIYLAYPYGTESFSAVPAVTKIGTSAAIRFSREKGAQHIGIAPAPGGRIWVFWLRDKSIVAARSNTTVTAFGSVTKLKPPKNANVVYSLAGEGSLGPLDLVALTDVKGTIDNWHQRILPTLTIKCSSATGKIKCKVTDAGVAVKGVKVSAGGKSKKTSSSGKVTISLNKGKYKVKATKVGYAPASTRARSK